MWLTPEIEVGGGPLGDIVVKYLRILRAKTASTLGMVGHKDKDPSFR